MWNHETETNLRAIAVLRVSSARQQDNTSHDVQETEILKYCQQNNLELIETRKITESAKRSNDRKKYNAAIEFALRSDIKHLLFYMKDRETRNLTDNERNEELVKSGHIVIHYVHDRKVIDKQSPGSDFFLRDIQAATAKNFIRDLAVKVADALKHKAEQGWYPGNHPPLGYINLKPKNADGREIKSAMAIVVPDPNKNKLRQIRREFELRAQGYSLEKICQTIKAEGFLKLNNCKSYPKSALERRLKNKIYWGLFDWCGVEYRGKHELIILKPILDKVTASFETNFAPRTKDNVPTLNNLIRCGDDACGKLIIFDPKKKKIKNSGEIRTHRYYHCTNSRRVHNIQTNVTESDLLTQFGSTAAAIDITEAFAAKIKQAVVATHDTATITIKAQAQEYRSKALELEKMEDTVYEHFCRGLIDKDQYRRKVGSIRQERRSYEDRLERANIAISDAVIKILDRLLELAINAKSQYKVMNDEQKVEFVKKVSSNRTLLGKTVRFDLQKPFAVLAEIKRTEEWLLRTDLNRRPSD